MCGISISIASTSQILQCSKKIEIKEDNAGTYINKEALTSEASRVMKKLTAYAAKTDQPIIILWH